MDGGQNLGTFWGEGFGGDNKGLKGGRFKRGEKKAYLGPLAGQWFAKRG